MTDTVENLNFWMDEAGADFQLDPEAEFTEDELNQMVRRIRMFTDADVAVQKTNRIVIITITDFVDFYDVYRFAKSNRFSNYFLADAETIKF